MVIDGVGNGRIQLPKGIVRELCEVHDSVHTLQVGIAYMPDVLAEAQWCRHDPFIETAITVETCIKPYNLMSTGKEHRNELCTNIAICASNKYVHRMLFLCVQEINAHKMRESL